MVELSVVVPSRRTDEGLPVLDALARDPFTDYETIVRSDAGVTTARNEGIGRASSRKIVFLDDDSEPRPGYLSRVAALLEDEAAVVGRTVHPRDDVFDRLAGHYDYGDEGRYVTRFQGCNMALRAEVFDDVGLWDASMGWGHEEKELADRVLRTYPIYYDPELVVDHPYAESIPDYWRKRYRLERWTPYYWKKTGVPRRQQWIRIGQGTFDPTNYVGVSVEHTLARTGGTVSAALGRLHGMMRTR